MKREELANQRRARGLSQERLAQKLGVATGTVSRWELGKMTPDPDIRENYAKELGVTVTTLSHWIDQNGDRPQLAPEWFTLYIGSEQTAAYLATFCPHVIHGLLQTREYAHELIQREQGSNDQVAQLVDLRMSRYSALCRDDNSLELEVIMSEAVLGLKVGGSSVMRAQLERVLKLAKSPNISVRILRLDAGPHMADRGEFTLLTMPWSSSPSLVYFETYAGGASYIESDDQIRYFEDLYNHLRTMSCDPDETVRMIEQAKDHYS